MIEKLSICFKENRAKMIGKRLFLLLIFIYCSVSAQIKGVVKDSLTGKPIPFVNIWVHEENIGSTFEEDGVFFINTAEKDKKLIFSTLGYEKKIIRASAESVVNLKPVAYTLDEVVISKSIGTKEIEIGNLKGKSSHSYGCGVKPWIVANYYPSTDQTEKHPFLKLIKFQTNSDINKAKLILHCYQVNKDGTPGNDLLSENCIVEVKKGTTINTINIEKYRLKFPENGIFIAIEWMMIEENKYSYIYSSYGTNKKLDGISYEPKLSAVFSETGNSWEYSSGQWKKIKVMGVFPNTKKYENTYSNLAVNISLTN
jgi:hypothetical protein